MSFRPLFRSFGHNFKPLSLHSCRSYASSSQFATIQTCPSPTCACSPTPSLPDGVKIDRKVSLNGIMPSYAEQVVICTGKSDWKSKIEEENDSDNLAQDLKELLGRGGKYSDPFHNVSVINSSFSSSISTRPEVQTTSVYLLPSFKYVPFLPRVSFDSVEALVKGYLLPKKLHAAHDRLSPIHRDRLRRREDFQSLLHGARDVHDVMVLICGHHGRDVRCGLIGPVLKEEFERVLPAEGVDVLHGAVNISSNRKASLQAPDGPEVGSSTMTARIGLISHIGGHKFAGNIIIYIPPTAKSDGGISHPLAGCGIWYGRVEPKHVEGIVRSTILRGEVIADMFRGAIKQGGEIYRL